MPTTNSNQSIENAKTYKIPEIEKFSGTPSKYPSFMAAIRRMFWSNPSHFSTDHKKIDFISGHLTGSAMVWFDAIITEGALAATNYEEFSTVFKSYFSDSGYVLKSTNQLMSIYQGKRSVAEYASEFRNLAIISEFNEKALIMQFQRGLNGRILDILINTPLPKTISELMNVCIEIDNRIASRDTFRPYFNYRHNTNNKIIETNNHRENTSTGPSDETPMEIDTLRVRPKGPLSMEEKRRRIENGLCLYCASDNHIVRDCKICPHTLKASPQQ
ncbi:Retrotransposon-derived protein PEG10 [Smittium culicis]|uniref:Retrotransposon-derived protein PEG10 n=1 Tax=Smittium culicis TaxID=133412 RepID=A0A1R1YFQ2_9FUNG|nr:Retrotransposon-derived protein PEG10 [Smittium culicis]